MRTGFVFAIILFPMLVLAQIMKTSVVASKTVTSEDIKYIGDVLHNSKPHSKMKCAVKTRESRELRKFKDGSEWVESLEVDFRSDAFKSDLDKNFIVTPGAKYGYRKSQHSDFGVIEEIRVELDDSHSSYIEFSHDGNGNLTGFLYGDIMRVYPCMWRR